MKHTLVARVQDQPGVLNRVASLFRRRAFNIDSLTVGQSEVQGFSRMTFVVDAARVPARLVEENLRKLIPVVDVHDVTHVPTVDRDLALILVEQRHVHRVRLAEQAEQREAALRELVDRPAPACLRNLDPGPRPLRLDRIAGGQQSGQDGLLGHRP